MLKRLMARLRPPASLRRRQGAWRVALQDGQLRVAGPAGRRQALAPAGLRRVLVEAEASGPLGADCWWQFFDAEGRLALRYPQGIAGESEVFDWLLALPGFDQAGMQAAMAATRPGVFAIWKRGPAS